MNFINLVDEDLLLWNKFRAGNADALAGLMRIHFRDLINYGSRFTRDDELVKDCLQELFLDLWKNRLSISETSFVKYYLLKSLRRKLNKAINKSKKFGIRQELYFDSMAFEPGLFIEDNILLNEDLSEQTEKVRSLLSKLSRRQQEIIYLRFYVDADMDEIAEIMNLNRQSVYNLLHDSIKKLKTISPPKKIRFSTLTNLLF